VVAAVVSGVRLLMSHVVGAPMSPRGLRTPNVLLVSLILLAMGYVSPALLSARYNLHLVLGMMCLISWLSGPDVKRRLADGAAAVTIVTGLMWMWWSDPGFGVDVAGVLRLARMPPERRLTEAPFPWTIAPDVAAARERELGPGTVALWASEFPFPSVLWNEHYTNTVGYLPSAAPDQMIKEARRRDATWVVAGKQSALYNALMARPSEWEQVGVASRGYTSIAFRRRQ